MLMVACLRGHADEGHSKKHMRCCIVTATHLGCTAKGWRWGQQGTESEVSVELDPEDEVVKRGLMAEMGLLPVGWCISS